MLSYEAAREHLLHAVRELESERIGLEEACGRVLAESLGANSPLPPFKYSAMDGYAVATRDLLGGGPWGLRVKGESRTGRPSAPLESGTACAISTGAEV